MAQSVSLRGARPRPELGVKPTCRLCVRTSEFDPCETFKRVDLCAKVLTQGPRRLMPPKSVDFDPPLPSGCYVHTARGTIQAA